MLVRSRVLPAVLALSVALAGCTATQDNADTADPAPPVATPEPPQPPARPPGETPGSQPPAPPQDVELADAGEIAGTFERTWDIKVENVAFQRVDVRFSVAGVQDGAPPTARVHLTLRDPDGLLVKEGSVGLGAPSNGLAWAFSTGQLLTPGSYQLKATTAHEAPLPSAGFATYSFAAHVDY